MGCLLQDPGGRVELRASFLPLLLLPFKSFLSLSNIGDDIQFSLCQKCLHRWLFQSGLEQGLPIAFGLLRLVSFLPLELPMPGLWFLEELFLVLCCLAMEWIFCGVAFPECVHVEPGGAELVIWGRNHAVYPELFSLSSSQGCCGRLNDTIPVMCKCLL